jgi:EAL domain-containing protein (putative c-di-GMP-specific phosphodiesterase class I)
LNLEITESAIIENVAAAPVLRRLKDLGVRLTADDFGTGYSSLTYLHRYPISGLKIDRSFIAGMNGNHESAQIVRTIVMLGNSLGLEVVAEGVETTQQLDILQEFHCRHAQGFLFSRPVPNGDAVALLTGEQGHQGNQFIEISER